MKKINLFAISALSCGLALVSCGAPTGDQILSNLAASALTGNTNTHLLKQQLLTQMVQVFWVQYSLVPQVMIQVVC